MNKIKVGVLGATGMVGQNYLRLLSNHPWFEVVDLSASNRSAGKSYLEAVNGKWLMNVDMPNQYKNMIVRDVKDVDSIPTKVEFFFSAVDLDNKEKTREFEFNYASLGFPVISNSSANRWTNDVPMIIPEINPHHSDIIPLQQKNRNFPKKGFVAVKPNCSIQSYLIALVALEKAGFPIKEVQMTTLQALSGAGAKGLTNPDWRENVIPFIGGEEEKTELEPLKILGKIKNEKIENYDKLKMSATCTRVPVIDGHTAIVQLNFKNKIPKKNEIINIWSNFKGKVHNLGLPSSPQFPIIYNEDNNRPQVKLDVNNGRGMTITLGRLEKDTFFDYKFIGLSHNTVRGASGGAILMAELLVKKGFIKNE
jgi:aspartate-semialdehyde dehydrogenase